MPLLPMNDTSYKPLYDILTGMIPAKVLETAIELNVFDHMETWRAAQAVSDSLGTHGDNTRHFLDALATIGLLEKKEGLYRNSPLANEYLVNTSPSNAGPLLQQSQAMSVKALGNLKELLMNGPCMADGKDGLASETLWAQAARDSASWVMNDLGSRIARTIDGLPGSGDMRTMLDLGGGHGMFAIYIAASSESLNAIVYDREPVLEVARDMIARYDMSERVGVMAGDYMNDDLGNGYDLIWASCTLNFAKNGLDPMISKIYSALNPDGYFISLHDGITNEMTQPDVVLTWLATLMSTGWDCRFEQGEIAGAMLRCGFRHVHSTPFATPMGALCLDIARK